MACPVQWWLRTGGLMSAKKESSHSLTRAAPPSSCGSSDWLSTLSTSTVFHDKPDLLTLWLAFTLSPASQCNAPSTHLFHHFSQYGKVSQCFDMKNHVCMPDDFGFGHMKHYVAINTTSWLDQSLDILENQSTSDSQKLVGMRNDNWIGSLEGNFSFAKNLYFYASELSTISSLSFVFVYLYFYLYLYYHQERRPWYWCFLGARADLLDIRPNSTYSTLCHSCVSTLVIVNKYVFVLVVVCICICTSCQL